MDTDIRSAGAAVDGQLTRGISIRHGDCLALLADIEAGSIDAVITDPPYELAFMGRAWDQTGVAFQVPIWAAIARVMKPGAHLFAFGGTRTCHRMTCAIEDAGLEIRDQLAWIYGTGFPKSHDVSKGIDKAAGAVREIVGRDPVRAAKLINQTGSYETEAGWSVGNRSADITAPATDAARQWQGWGTALKPAHEPIILARKPLDGNVAQNVLKHGTGAINVDACRVPSDAPIPVFNGNRHYDDRPHEPIKQTGEHSLGRWPANLAHDGSPEVLEAFARFGEKTSGKPSGARKAAFMFGEGFGAERGTALTGFGDTGTAARFFYSAKASGADRAGSKHPTVKPISLLRWLCRLITPPGGVILDPFAGSGTTGAAADAEGFQAILIEREAEYIADIRRRFADPIQAELF